MTSSLPRPELATASRTLLLCLALVAATGCGQDADSSSGSGQSVLVITIDTVRTDAVGCFGGRPGITPNLDALATESVRYTSARATAPITLPSHASMFTGLYPAHHSVHDNSLVALSGEASTTAEVLQAAGYQTAAFVGAIVLDRAYGLSQGFELYDQPSQPLKIRSSKLGFFAERPASDMLPRIQAWLESRDRERPFFVWAHFFDAHMPYEPAPEYLEQAAGNGYLAEVAAVDAAIGQLVDQLRAEGALENTIVAVLADHGEDLEQHGEPSHSLLIYDTTMRVPFLVRYPDGRAAGTTVEQSVTVADLHPTLLDALGVDLPDVSYELDGQSLLQPIPADRGVYLESYAGYLNYGWLPIAGWAQARDKTIFGARAQVFDIVEDPGEVSDLWTPSLELPALHEVEILAVLARPALAADDSSVDNQQLESLQALGYAGVGFVPDELQLPLAESQLPDPHDSLPEFLLIQRSLDLKRQGNYNDAAALLASVLEQNPRNFKAMQEIASALISAENYADARYWLEKTLDTGFARSHDIANLGLAYERSGLRDEAESYYRQALARQSTCLPAVRGLARMLDGDPEHTEEHDELRARARELRGVGPVDAAQDTGNDSGDGQEADG